MTTGSRQQKANVFGNGSGRKQIQRATSNVTNDKTKEMWQRVNPATSGSGEAPLQQRQAQENSKIDSGKKINAANNRIKKKQIQRATTCEISKNTKSKMQRQANSAANGSGSEQLQKQQRQEQSERNGAIKQQQHTKCTKQKINVETGGGKQRQNQQTENLKICGSRRKQCNRSKWQANVSIRSGKEPCSVGAIMHSFDRASDINYTMCRERCARPQKPRTKHETPTKQGPKFKR